MFTLRFTPTVLKDLKKLPRPISKRIIEKIQQLEQNPYIKSTKRLVRQPYFCLRVGDYRVIYEIRKMELIIIIIKVAHRKNIYR